MNTIKTAALFAAAMCGTIVFADWAGNQRYAAANGNVKPGAVVFYGDSITDAWPGRRSAFFNTNGFVGRGISGQTTAEMLCRFRQDVINLKPETVVILAGINDMAENRGPISHEAVMNNIISMCELAKANGIGVRLCSVTPSDGFPWRKEIKDVSKRIVRLNGMIKEYAENNGIPYVDYYSALANENGGMGKYSGDGVHPNDAGYAVMESIVIKTL